MPYKITIDNKIGRRGRVVVSLMDGAKVLDREIVLKHPFLLRIRIRLAMRRLRVRARKIGRMKEKLGLS